MHAFLFDNKRSKFTGKLVEKYYQVSAFYDELKILKFSTSTVLPVKLKK